MGQKPSEIRLHDWKRFSLLLIALAALLAAGLLLNLTEKGSLGFAVNCRSEPSTASRRYPLYVLGSWHLFVNSRNR